MKKKAIISLVFILSALRLFAQADEETKFIVDIPVLDLPANTAHSTLALKQFSPSMQQSLNWTKSIAEAQQYYTKRVFFNPDKDYSIGGKMLRNAGLILANTGIELLLGGTPLGTGWTHEEWHRAVMNKNNVRSFNEMNYFPIGKDAVSVSRETDEDLARFKADNNPDFVRMNVAGIEAQYEYVKALQKDNFYYNINLFSQVSYFFNVMNNIDYVRTCADPEGDKLTKEMESEEGTDISKRDFTGLDMVAWIYDLSRPDIPYAARGLHPSGVGIRRYRQTTDLTTEELDYLKKMGKLQFLNLVSPQMIFINSIRLNDDLRFNFSLFHYLSSFGYDLGGNVFLEYNSHKVFFALHNYHNLNNSFYGVEAQLIDKELNVYNHTLNFTPSVHVWTQPQNQGFRESKSQLGGKVSLAASVLLNPVWRPYIDVSVKSAGWVAGDPYLNSNVNFRVGVRAFVR